MKKLNFLLIISTLLQLNLFTQEVKFPLDIGNKWYYQVESNVIGYYYGCTYEIINILNNGFREVTRKYHYSKDSTKLGKEYWAYIEGKFYVNYEPVMTTSSLYYDDYLYKDTCWSLIQTKCWKVFDYQIFNISGIAQKSTEYFNVGGRSEHSKTVFPDIGIVETYSWSIPRFSDLTEYRTHLIGMYKNGELLGDTVFTIPTSVDEKITSKRYYLSQNYPNPFNPTTTISYQLPHSGMVTLKIYNILGKEVATLVNEEKPAGYYNVEFSAGSLSSGIYFYRLQSGSFVETKKLILMK